MCLWRGTHGFAGLACPLRVPPCPRRWVYRLWDSCSGTRRCRAHGAVSHPISVVDHPSFGRVRRCNDGRARPCVNAFLRYLGLVGLRSVLSPSIIGLTELFPQKIALLKHCHMMCVLKLTISFAAPPSTFHQIRLSFAPKPLGPLH